MIEESGLPVRAIKTSERTIKLNPVVSSNVNSIGYDEASKTLSVLFKNNTLYAYENVPHSVYLQLGAAPSIGKFLNENIKPNYSYKKVE